ncbi:hypothetical protein GCM10027082_24320 [Comamonas humi]
MRRLGYKPAAAFVTDASDKLSILNAERWQDEPNRFDQGRFYAEIQLDEADVPEQVDFRPLVGLDVHIHGFRSDSRTTRIFNVIKRIKPALLIAILDQGHLFFTKEIGDELHSHA